MSLSQMSVRNLLTFSILLVSLFLFTQNTNADTFTVDTLSGGADNANCDVSPPNSSKCAMCR